MGGRDPAAGRDEAVGLIDTGGREGAGRSSRPDRPVIRPGRRAGPPGGRGGLRGIRFFGPPPLVLAQPRRAAGVADVAGEDGIGRGTQVFV
ncbi:hypothetical protein ADK86_12965, partial [Streptomyces sp. NRRL F-5755]